MITRCYSDLIKIDDFLGRFQYLRLNGKIGIETFGYERFLNQVFYRSNEWKKVRAEVILRDEGRDLGIEGRELNSRIFIHHMNPLTLEDIERKNSNLLNPEYLITVSFETHQAIHYGNENNLMLDPVVRTKYDTCPWRL